MFDIYLVRGCNSLPEMEDLFDLIPALATSKVQENLLKDSPGFLGFDLPLEAARRLIKRLKYAGTEAGGQIIPSKYRDNQPNYTIETAYPIAEETLKKIQSSYSDISFGPITYVPGSSGLMYITFVSIATEWTEEGLVPDGIFVSVDKLDGHIWSDEEMLELSDTRY